MRIAPARRVSTARRAIAIKRGGSARRALALALAPLVATGVAACGSTVSTGSYKGASAAVVKRIADFQTDVTAGEEKKLCDQDLAAAVSTRLRAAGGSCRQALKNQLGAIDDYELAVESIAVHGTSATARVKSTWSGKQRTTTMRLVKEGGTWKVQALQ
jgi:hypothetical protein